MLVNFLLRKLRTVSKHSGVNDGTRIVVIPFYNLQQCTQKQSYKIILNPSNFNSHLSLNNLY